MMQLAAQLRQKMADGVVLGSFVMEFRTPAVPIVLANAGMDFIIIDTEHGWFDPETVRGLMDIGPRAQICPIVRVPTTHRSEITHALDNGASGLLFPMIRTMDDVLEAVEASKYPPLGQRGVHMMRPHTDFQPPTDKVAYCQQANASLLTILQIETLDALGQVEQIAKADGVDMLYVGPSDLSADMGHFGGLDHPETTAAAQRIAKACIAAGKPCGCHVERPDQIAGAVKMGFNMIGYAGALRLFMSAANAFCADARQSIAEAGK